MVLSSKANLSPESLLISPSVPLDSFLNLLFFSAALGLFIPFSFEQRHKLIKHVTPHPACSQGVVGASGFIQDPNHRQVFFSFSFSFFQPIVSVLQASSQVTPQRLMINHKSSADNFGFLLASSFNLS